MVHPVEIGGGQGCQHGLGVFVSVGIFPVVADLGLAIQNEKQLLDEIPFSIDQLIIPIPPDRTIGQVLLYLHQGDGLEDQSMSQQYRQLVDLPRPDLLEISIKSLVLEPQQNRDLLGPDGIGIGFVSL